MGVTNDGVKLNVWDIGGQKAIRPYWSNYFDASDALVYVVDSADNRRFAESTEELLQLLQEDKLANIPVLIFANKQDLQSAVKQDHIVDELKLDQIPAGRNWTVQACSAMSGEGLDAGLQWLIENRS